MADAAGLVAVVAALVVVFALTTDHFLSVTTFRTIANQVPDGLLVATGMTFVIIAGGIDLSVGSVMALSGAVLGTTAVGWGWPMPLAATAAVTTGTACGLLNGLVVARWAIPSFIVTLGTLEMARGATYLVTRSQTIYVGERIEGLSAGLVGGLGLPFFAAALVLAAGQLALTRTVFGRRLFAVGNSAEAAWLAGIDPRRVRAAAFTIAGGLAGLAAVVQAARLAAVDPNAGLGMELEAIAAVVIGGTSLSGGRGSALRSALGVVIIAVLAAGLAQLGVQEPTRRLITGAVIVVAAIGDRYRR